MMNKISKNVGFNVKSQESLIKRNLRPPESQILNCPFDLLKHCT